MGNYELKLKEVSLEDAYLEEYQEYADKMTLEQFCKARYDLIIELGNFVDEKLECLKSEFEFLLMCEREYTCMFNVIKNHPSMTQDFDKSLSGEEEAYLRETQEIKEYYSRILEREDYLCYVVNVAENGEPIELNPFGMEENLEIQTLEDYEDYMEKFHDISLNKEFSWLTLTELENLWDKREELLLFFVVYKPYGHTICTMRAGESLVVEDED